MRVGVINVGRLTRVRRTFRYQWRIIIIAIFSFFAFVWWSVFNQVRVEQIAGNDRFQARSIAFALVLLPILGVAFFKKNAFARLIFALITLFNLLNLLPFAVVGVIALIPRVPWSDPNIMFFVVLVALAVPAFFWDFLIAHPYVLFLSVMPFGRMKAFRNQVSASLLLWAGHWKSHDDGVVETGERLRPSAGARYRLSFGGMWIIVALVCLVTAGFSLLNSEFMPALFHLQFAKAWHMIRHFQLTEPTGFVTFSETIFHLTPSLLLTLLGLGCFSVFGYFLSQWRRENTLVFRRPILQHLTSSDVLLLRTFNDDVKYVGRERSPWMWMLPIQAIMWTYTFEELIVKRLGYLGKVRLLDIDPRTEALTENWWLRNFFEKKWLKWLLEKRWIKKLVASQKLKRFLISIFPAFWYKLPSQGGIRYYVDSEDKRVWQEQIVEAMCTARMIVVLLGTTESLAWEMNQIQEHNLSEKAVFVMPPVRSRKNYRVRWQQFIKYLNDNGMFDTEPLKKVKPQHVRAVCVHRDIILVLTGKRSSRLFYEAALDMVTLFTVANPAHSRSMIYKYLS